MAIEFEIPADAMLRDLDRTLNDVVKLHNDEPAKYYFEEGNKDGVLLARAVLAFFRLLTRTSSDEFYQDERSVPIHPLFERIKIHISQIVRFYVNHESELIQKFIDKLVPSNPNPLRFIVLSSMSLFTARVYLHPKSMQPNPVQAYVDGFFNLVIDLTDNVVRIPLIPKKYQEGQSLTSATLPPSLRFKGFNESDEKVIREFIFDEAPKNGRKMQFHAFLSVINAAKPVMSYVDSLRAALTSIDLSFAISLCVLCTNPDDFTIIPSLLNVFMCDKRFDFFIRALSVAGLRYVQSASVIECLELVSLANIFISTSFKLTQKVSHKGGIPQIISTICDGLNQRKFPDLVMYILKASLIVAAYSDKSGSDTIAMLLEITIRPFAAIFSLTEQYEKLKLQIIQKDEKTANLRGIVEQCIIGILHNDISIQYKPGDVQIGVQDIHDFIFSRLDEFINLVIYLNDRQRSNHPTVQMIRFAYDMCVKHGMI